MRAMMSDRASRAGEVSLCEFGRDRAEVNARRAEREARRILGETEQSHYGQWHGDPQERFYTDWTRPAVAAVFHGPATALADSLSWFLAADLDTIAEMQR